MKCLILLGALCCGVALADADHSEDWFDQAEAEEARLRQINAGSLEFHATPPDTRIHKLHNRLEIDADSLQSGYVALRQCHDSLDPIRRAEVSYRYRSMRDLRLESWEGIGRAWVEGDSVQMEDVQEGARLCINARVRVLHPLEGGGYQLRSGPFHRRFLDGYFPMQVILDIQYPASLLHLASMEPAPRPGLSLKTETSGVQVIALFSGRLSLVLAFDSP